MKKLFLILGLLSTLFVACSKDGDDTPKPTLTLSQSTDLVISSEAGTQNISVTTNQTPWDAQTKADWITITKQNKSFDLAFSANESADPREAEITVTAGSLVKSFKVKQDGFKASITLNPSTINAGSEEKSYTVNVKSTNEWSTEYEKVDWFTVTEDKAANKLTINVIENTAKEQRTATITVKDNAGTSAKLNLTQKGMTVQYYLPYLDPDMTVAKVKEFEKGRGYKLDKEDANNEVGTTKLTFTTTSDLLPKIEYDFVGDYVSTIITYAKDGSVLNEKYTNLLLDENFDAKEENFYSKNVQGKTYKYTLDVSVIINETGKQSGVIFEIYPNQPNPQASFTTLPIEFTTFTDVTLDDIKKWETEKGSTYNATASSDADKDGISKRMFDVKDTENSIVTRGYFLKETENKMLACSIFFSDISKFLYEANDQLFFTDEFEQLLEKDGYQSVQGTENITFANFEKKIFFILGYGSFKGINNEEPVIQIQYAPIPDSASSASAYTISNEFSLKSKRIIVKK